MYTRTKEWNLQDESLKATSIPICKWQAYNSHCREQLCYEKFLSFGKSRLVPNSAKGSMIPILASI